MPASSSDAPAVAFERLARPIQRWIRDRGWTNLRPVQAEAIDTIMDDERDVIVTAATAGGKTEAAFLPLLSDVLDEPGNAGGFDLVYIGPLKALITDQALRLEGMLEKTGVAVHPWHGDVAKTRKDRALKSPGGVLLITPESLEAMFVLRGREVPGLFAGTRAIVIDELHTFLDSDRGVHLRSLMSRLDIAVGRRIRRVGLSATLGEMELVRSYLNPDAPKTVHLIADDAPGQELQIQLRGYVEPGEDGDGPPNEVAIARHLFGKLRGSRNLVFAGSRQRVEIYADRLARMCEREKVPVEFLPHHGSLSRDRRTHVEDTLREGRMPLTAICTSTLELGIDIGDVICVGQIGAPFSVASLRQRLGRSGRRAGEPAVLRMYIPMPKLEPQSNPIDRLRLDLVQGIAMIDLLLEKWCEPPAPGALNLSTLTHQVLSIIAERGGASAPRLYKMLSERGPFQSVDPSLFTALLRDLGRPDTALIEQAPDGLLMLGEAGERIVAHYGFYAVFQTPEEYRLLASGREIGSLPVDNILMPGMTLVFAGRRWRIEAVDDAAKVIELVSSQEGAPPIFGGDGGAIHDDVRARMRLVLEGRAVPRYLDAAARDALAVAREDYDHLRLRGRSMVGIEEKKTLLAPWAGTVRTSTLTLALRGRGLQADPDGAVLEMPCGIEDLRTDHLPGLREGGLDLSPETGATLSFDKFHEYLSPTLLIRDALSSRLDRQSLGPMVKALLAGCD